MQPDRTGPKWQRTPGWNRTDGLAPRPLWHTCRWTQHIPYTRETPS